MASLSNRLLANKRFEFTSSAFDDDKFAVVDMEGVESISQVFRFTLTLVTDDASIDFDKMLQNPATFLIRAPDGNGTTPYHGVLASLDQLHRADGYVFYRAVLVPRLWHLSLYRISEVYLNEQAIPDIIESVLKGSRLSTADFELKLTGQYRARSFVCQYQESHLDFLARWMEKEGMYYYFDHSGTSEKLIIADNRMMHAADALQVNYRPADELDTGLAPDAVQDFVCRQQPLPRQVVLQDFNHRKASVTLKASEIVSESGFGDVMIYGENFRDEQEGKRYAKLRAEEIICGGKVFSGAASAVGLRSGYFIELAHHYRDDFNGQYLVTEVQHSGSQAGALLEGIRSPFGAGSPTGETNYRTSFRAIPAAVQFRAERVTAKPRVAGTMNATIDSEGSGDYAELDAYGQYKVQLPFDRTEKNANKGSARVRMATPYAGSNHGMHFPLHKNAEVLLSFIDGDPDQPVIVGAVPNSENISIVNQNNPAENKISTAGGNQLHMSDTKGKEVIWLNSPFHSSSIGIGSVDPKGGGSVFAATMGSNDSVTLGNVNSMSFGSANTLSVGTATGLDLSFANKVSMGASISVSMANAVAWNMNLNPLATVATPYSLTIDDSNSVAFNDTQNEQIALESYSISAGHATFDPNVLSVKATQKIIKAVIAAYTTLNLAASTAFSLYVNGRLGGDVNDSEVVKKRIDAQSKRNAAKDDEIDEVNAKYAGKNSPSDEKAQREELAAIEKKYAQLDFEATLVKNNSEFVGGWPGVITKMGVDAVLNGAALLAIQGYARTLATKLKALQTELISKMTLDKTGIKLNVDFPIAPLGTGGGNAVLLDAKGIRLNAVHGPAMEAKLSLKGDTGVVLSSATNNKFTASQTAVSMGFGKQIVTTTATETSMGFASGQAAVKLDAVGAKMSAGSNSSVVLTKASLKLSAVNNAISMEAGRLKIQAQGGSSAELTPVGFSATGQLIKLG